MCVENKIVQVIADQLSINPEKIKNPQTLKWDSLKHISLVTAIEDEFDVFFDPEEISEMLNYNSIVKIVKEKLEA